MERVQLDRHSQPVNVCIDPACPGWVLPDSQHFDQHNQLCGHLSVGQDGTEILCALPAGHDPPCRGAAWRDY